METHFSILWCKYNRFGQPFLKGLPNLLLVRYVSPQDFLLKKHDFFFYSLTKSLKQTAYRESETGSSATGV
ncbi:MAG: hypothetical protein CVU09_17535 [Bacteroidetes bacterium HGW-Bacteroidetes-4]|nr:MAG: hypothetical protein CVU09_17535 [Bacteroidetes bacterium HGW-Bacteroidetes-4]